MFTLDGVLDRIANINRLCVIGRHQFDQAVNQIRYVLERSGLFAIAVNLKQNAIAIMHFSLAQSRLVS